MVASRVGKCLKGDLREVQGQRLWWNVLGPEDSKEAGAAGRVQRRRGKSAGFHGVEPMGGGTLSRRHWSQGLVGRVRLAFSHSWDSLEGWNKRMLPSDLLLAKPGGCAGNRQQENVALVAGAPGAGAGEGGRGVTGRGDPLTGRTVRRSVQKEEADDLQTESILLKAE